MVLRGPEKQLDSDGEGDAMGWGLLRMLQTASRQINPCDDGAGTCDLDVLRQTIAKAVTDLQTELLLGVASGVTNVHQFPTAIEDLPPTLKVSTTQKFRTFHRFYGFYG